MTKIIGLTGGIGSGKTTVAKIFGELGAPVFIADDAAREVMNSREMSDLLLKEFGSGIFDDHVLNRKKLAAIVFEDREKLSVLNNIVHPAVQRLFNDWLKMQEHADFVIREAAILFESGSYKDCDKIITVTAPLDIRIERVMQRDKVAPEEVLRRMKHQWTDAQKIEKSDFVIVNDDLNSLGDKVREIFENLKNI